MMAGFLTCQQYTIVTPKCPEMKSSDDQVCLQHSVDTLTKAQLEYEMIFKSQTTLKGTAVQ
jgi:hypothetical protein